MVKEMIISPSPHVHAKDNTRRIMRDVLIALMPAFVVSLYFYGVGSLLVTSTAVAACVLFESLIQRFMIGGKSSIGNLSAIVTGVLLGFNLPHNIPIWLVIIGALVAIGVGKMSFGGLGRNLFNPALVGRVFLLISFPVYMTTFSPPPSVEQLSASDTATGATSENWKRQEAVATERSAAFWDLSSADANSGPTLLAYVKSALADGQTTDQIEGIDYKDIFLGKRSGSLGEIGALALLLGFAYLLIRKVITWHIPVAVLGTMAIFSGAMWLVDPLHNMHPAFHLITGGALLGAIFMATDYTTSPMNRQGMIIYGVGIGLITMFIRLWGSYPEGVSFAILIMNAAVPLIDKYVKPKRFAPFSTTK